MSKQPNILLILSDQHRADCVGIENHPVLLTPTLDHIAAEGTYFSRCYSTCPVCVPARRSLLSGQFPHTHGARSHVENEWQCANILPALLGRAGYHSYLVGRDMHQYPIRKRFGYDHVVSQYDYFSWLDQKTQDNVYPKGISHYSGGYYSAGILHNDWTARPWHLDETLHMTNWTVSRAIEFLQNRDPSCPFFLTLSFLAPHPPFTPPAFYMERYLRQTLPAPVVGDWAEIPPHGGRGLAPDSPQISLSGEALQSCLAGYYGLINHMDDQLRRILNPVDGLYRGDNEDTVIIYTSDHGEMLGDHCLFRKSQPYEGSARVPLFIRLPEGRFPRKLKNNAINAPVCLEDILPTLLDIAGLEIPASVQGESLLSALRGESTEVRRETHIEYENAFHALTDGHEKYIFLKSKNTEQLFDLDNDPNETINLAAGGSHAERVSGWRQRLLAVLREHPEVYCDDIHRVETLQ